jgi:hypothetical protein
LAALDAQANIVGKEINRLDKAAMRLSDSSPAEWGEQAGEVGDRLMRALLVSIAWTKDPHTVAGTAIDLLMQKGELKPNQPLILEGPSDQPPRLAVMPRQKGPERKVRGYL